MIAAVILAAGASSRMGSPKALLPYRGETFLNRLIRVMGRECAPVIVVLGYHSAEVRASAVGGVEFVVNRDPERGQFSSFQCGLQRVPADAEGFLFLPVDSPSVAESTVHLLVARFRSRKPGTLFVIPRYGEKRGHPVLGDPSLLSEFLALPATGQAKEIVHRHVPDTEYVDVADPGILADIDDRLAYQQLMEQSPRESRR